MFTHISTGWLQKRKWVTLMFLLFLVVLPGTLSAVTLKLASPFPEGSAWDLALKRMASEWAETTNGQVRMRIYPGGVAGDDANMVRKMRFGQIDLAVLTSFGMKEIVPDSFVMTIPGLLRTEEELQMVLDDFVSVFDEEFLAEGFRVLSWSQSGWAYLYSRDKVSTVEELRRTKLSVSSSDERVVEIFKALDFNVVPSSLNEVMVGLQSGMITSLYAPPVAAGVYQWFALAPYMQDLPVAPVLGGLVITDRAWKRIPEQYRDKLKESIETVSAQFASEAERTNTQAMDVMKKNGLQLVQPNAAFKKEWQNVLAAGTEMAMGKGKWVSREVYDDLHSRLEAMR